jgi:hypothetical protein
MKNFIAPFVSPASANGNWDNNTGKLKQIFKSITGYDIMFKESRKDIVPTGNTIVLSSSSQAFSALLSNSIKNISNIIRARMM